MPASPRQKAGALAAAISAAFAIVAPLTMQSEGLRLTPYRDPVGIPTVCWGATKGVENRSYTRDECTAILRRDFAAHAEGVAACVPTITDARRIYVFAASVDFAFNAGVSTFCKSSMAREFNAGRWATGCQKFGLYRLAGGKVLPGLVKRRSEETQLCMKGA